MANGLSVAMFRARRSGSEEMTGAIVRLIMFQLPTVEGQHGLNVQDVRILVVIGAAVEIGVVLQRKLYIAATGFCAAPPNQLRTLGSSQ